MQLDGSRFLVTGATGGIGAPIARRLAEGGATLTLVARDRERLDALAVDGRRLAADLRDPEACAAAVAAAAQDGPLAGVVNAVGVVAFGPVDELGADVMEELFLTNTFVPIMLAMAALPHFGDDGGVIVNLAGVVAEQSFPRMAAYAASKAAVRAFDEGLATEVRRRKIRVVNARPPHTETGLADRPIAGTAPRFPTGLDPDDVARRVVEAIVADERDLPSSAFGSRA